MRIGACEMALDHPACAFVLEHGRQVRGIKAARAARYQRSKRLGAHQRMHLRNILDAKMVGLVHGSHP